MYDACVQKHDGNAQNTAHHRAQHNQNVSEPPKIMHRGPREHEPRAIASGVQTAPRAHWFDEVPDEHSGPGTAAHTSTRPSLTNTALPRS